MKYRRGQNVDCDNDLETFQGTIIDHLMSREEYVITTKKGNRLAKESQITGLTKVPSSIPVGSVWRSKISGLLVEVHKIIPKKSGSFLVRYKVIDEGIYSQCEAIFAQEFERLIR